ncbi:hypothetical protein BD289DRAFT_28187 [Coniella lustricola]|uniref:Uncharacterized protein n=1 Tax=Coniella lustricola TaxID=2025994 RepID=A0A2T3AJ17_9PEZI|nr:hypothetical protein BD289DRAFT_28187 [Coniella lustricola]
MLCTDVYQQALSRNLSTASGVQAVHVTMGQDAITRQTILGQRGRLSCFPGISSWAAVLRVCICRYRDGLQHPDLQWVPGLGVLWLFPFSLLWWSVCSPQLWFTSRQLPQPLASPPCTLTPNSLLLLWVLCHRASHWPFLPKPPSFLLPPANSPTRLTSASSLLL